jgi:hypothetical protein
VSSRVACNNPMIDSTAAQRLLDLLPPARTPLS